MNRFLLAALGFLPATTLLSSATRAAPPATAPATQPATTQPASIFWPLDAGRIIIISDCSGSFMQKFDPLRAEIRRTIALLKSEQQFNIVFMQEGNASMLSRKSLLHPTKENLQKADDFLTGTAPRGATEPITALRLAFALKPDVIFLLTDGDFPDNDATIAEVRKLNADHRVKVCTIAFMDKGETYEKVLAQIAKENGGKFRFISEEEVGK